jgi:predicted permease
MQVALSLVLLVGAGMFARSLLNLQAEDLGFRGESLLLVDVDPRIAGFKPAELPDLYTQVFDRLSAVPGVESVTAASYSPMGGTSRTSNVSVEGYTPGPEEDVVVQHLFVGPNYSETLGLPLLAGRDIGVQDTPASRRVALVNQSFADYFFRGQNAVGRRFCVGDFTEEDAVEIVGVVGDAKYGDVRDEPLRTVYLALLQEEGRSAYDCNLELRAAGDPAALATTVRAAIRQAAPRLPVVRVTTFSQQLGDRLRQERLMAQLVAAFGVLALVLACVGLYGVIAQAVARRTNEIGIRMALGANPRHVLRMVLGEALAKVAIGVAIGLVGAVASARLIANMLFGVGQIDPAAILIALLLMLGTALVAGYVPARRATKVDPVEALKYE